LVVVEPCAWLGNQANAAVGTVRAVMVVVGVAAFWFALEHDLVWRRIVAAAALVASWPLLAAARPLVGMAIVLAVLVALVGMEVWRREGVFPSSISPPHGA
jgi:hypothetical protein